MRHFWQNTLVTLVVLLIGQSSRQITPCYCVWSLSPHYPLVVATSRAGPFSSTDRPRDPASHPRSIHAFRVGSYSDRYARRGEAVGPYEEEDDDPRWKRRRSEYLSGRAADTRYTGESEVERELRNMPLENRNDDDDDAFRRGNVPSPRRREVALDRGGDYDDDYLVDDGEGDPSVRPNERYLDDDDEDGKERNFASPQESLGNFWSNPQEGVDRYPSSRRPGTRRPTPTAAESKMPPSTAQPHQRESNRRISRTTFRSGTPAPPPPMTDFYNRLFWYGFDPDESTTPADRTMFGGTKGKFNGLAYLYNGEATLPEDLRRRRPRPDSPRKDGKRDAYYYNYDDDDVGNVYEEEDKTPYESATWRTPDSVNPTPTRRPQPVTPPYDPPRPMRAPGPFPSKSAGQGARSRKKPAKSDSAGDWVLDEVAKWFSSQDDDDDENDPRPKSRSRRRQAKANYDDDGDNKDDDLWPAQSWSPFSVLDAFLGLDRKRLDVQADEYNRQMGLDRRQEPRSRSASSRARRQGYAYKYEDDEEEIPTPVVADYEVAPPPTSQAVRDVETLESSEEQAKYTMSWEERALAVERVPPIGIPAWGPTGDLGVDARTKAVSDALEDLHLAKRRIEEQEKLVNQARDEIGTLRVDAELQRRRWRKGGLDPRTVEDRVRVLEKEVDDAARRCRYAEQQLLSARETLAKLESRHWAVLRAYDPNLAEKNVDEALRELEETEPAARRYADKWSSSESSESSRSGSAYPNTSQD